MAEKLDEFGRLLREAHERVNLISRKDTEHLEYRHIAFCAAIGELLVPEDGAKIADVGTGGGLPGIVMAVIWPKARIKMFDGVGKKIRAVSEMIERLGLKNAEAVNSRIESQPENFDYITGRAVCSLPEFFRLVGGKIRRGKRGNLPNGVLYFKGGDLDEELLRRKILPGVSLKLDEFFSDPSYEGKSVVHFDSKSVGDFCGLKRAF